MDARGEGARPFHHRGVEMRVRNGDGVDAAEAFDQRDGRVIERGDAIPQDIAGVGAQQQRALADGEMRLRADAEDAVSYSRKALKWLSASAASVVQVCPRGGTYCRSSSQMTHCAGGFSLSAYCVPQAVQMKAGIDHSVMAGLARRRRAERPYVPAIHAFLYR